MNVLQTIVNGTALGAVYALVAVGLALVFGVMRLVNFAHGELITAGAYTLALTSSWALPLSLVTCLAVTVAMAVLIERVAFRPLRNASPASALVATFAIAIALQALWVTIFGPEGRTADVLGSLNRVAIRGQLDLRWVTIVELVGGGLLLAALAAFIARTDLGLQMRAAAADTRAARLLGVRADRVIGTAFVLAGISCGVAAMLLTVADPLVTPGTGLGITIPALVGIVVGGLDRLSTATAGGFVIGFVNSALGDVLSSSTRVFLPAFVFLLVIVVLLMRPAGLFSRQRLQEVERV
jgi:branched-chain amino acid transport system permease protein